MKDLLELMKTRRSVRKYKPDMIPQDVLDRIIIAGTYSATGRNLQSPIIIAVTNKEMRDKISEMNRKIGGWDEGFEIILPSLIQEAGKIKKCALAV